LREAYCRASGVREGATTRSVVAVVMDIL